jgi:hypothetical protein
LNLSCYSTFDSCSWLRHTLHSLVELDCQTDQVAPLNTIDLWPRRSNVTCVSWQAQLVLQPRGL